MSIKRQPWAVVQNGRVVYQGPAALAWVQYGLTVGGLVVLLNGKGRAVAMSLTGVGA